jgi:LssY C-terminus
LAYTVPGFAQLGQVIPSDARKPASPGASVQDDTPVEPKSTPTNRCCGSMCMWRRVVALIAVVALAYYVVAYVIIPAGWEHYAHRHPALDDMPGITTTGSGIPGDPINVALIGTKTEVIKIMLKAKWHPADPLSLKSCLEIAEATILKRPYEDAPVSNLYLWGRKEDLAFEQQVGDDPKQRHHVRYWRSEQVDDDGRPSWAGSVTFDKSVGLSHTTGQITHHISADLDAERDRLMSELEATGDLAEQYAVDGFHKVLSGKNGGGDPWHTDGRLFVGVIAQDKKK